MTTDRRTDAELNNEANHHLAGEVETIANKMQDVVDELEAAAERKDYRAIDAKFVELRSLYQSLDETHDDLPAVPEVA